MDDRIPLKDITEEHLIEFTRVVTFSEYTFRTVNRGEKVIYIDCRDKDNRIGTICLNHDGIIDFFFRQVKQVINTWESVMYLYAMGYTADKVVHNIDNF